MQIITPDFIYFHDKIASNLSVAFDKSIQKVAPFDELIQQYPDAIVTKLQKNSLLMPGLINAHVHLEFSGNSTELSYGNFMQWLYSVIEKREELIGSCSSECMNKAVNLMLDSGITSFGAISSHGMDLETCQNAPQNVVYFNELIGSQAVMADTLFGDFISRLNASKSSNKENLYPGVAIHSPYSVHPVLIRKALEIVKDQNLPLSAHFMESEAEREWLDKNEGNFKEFFKNFLKQDTAVTKSKEFLDHFEDYHTLFTHSVEANEEELNLIAKDKHTIIHCPISNRLLGNKMLNLKKLNEKNIPWIVATDGLSSNYSLDLFEEMKISLLMHNDEPLLDLAKQLLQSVTIHAAQALNLNSGEIKEGKNADMIIIDLDKEPSKELPIHLILHRYNISKIYINGNLIKEN